MRPLTLALIAAMALLVTSPAARADPQPQSNYQVFLPLAVGPTSATPGQVAVRDVRTFIAGDTSRYVVGEVVNGTTAVAYGVRVAIRLYDAGGALLLDDLVFTRLSQIPPGGRAGFSWIDAFPPAGVARVEASVIGQDPEPWPSYHLATVTSASAEQTADGVRAVGLVRNDGAAALHSTRISATFYDASGRVLFVEYNFLPAPLQPGQSAAYTVETSVITSCDHVSVTAEGFYSSL